MQDSFGFLVSGVNCIVAGPCLKGLSQSAYGPGAYFLYDLRQTATVLGEAILYCDWLGTQHAALDQPITLQLPQRLP
ncbi:hypothetical protein WL71_14405 [Burkholderia ubonensis]|uniref:Uncharacterized protein n=1 Tax=Burkholderia ubonensis TaxID=101571 RepID=A0A119VJ80_9BURK|nr:hypothetical protein WL70_29385 [Burkholderia ubonensis]KWD84601.1 hypothetical protein WL71_14405 [Burkholderia ubonensis]KWD91906.1 hypothetical protein WL73_29700 [Burkholderia ubonensis]KWD96676.1 hypothetical protein WL72_20945 [Burkholderia ubonensis]KWN14011.1 hypothetical protein WM21_15845 [Burkholderia ubonensis]